MSTAHTPYPATPLLRGRVLFSKLNRHDADGAGLFVGRRHVAHAILLERHDSFEKDPMMGKNRFPLDGN